MDSQANRYEPPATDVALTIDPQTMELAGKGRRFATFLIDYLGFFVLSACTGIVAGLVLGEAGMDMLERIPEWLLGLSVFLVYYLFFEGIWGRTPGKWLLGTRVVDESGRPPSFLQVLGRTASRFIPFEAFSFFGTLGWHDSLPKTRVIRTR
jgi:uncharacterized RDD family membrane protein YckC